MRATTRAYEVPDYLNAFFELVTTLFALAVACLSYAALRVHVGLAVLPGLVAVGLLVRVFIVAHHCAHGSFLRSRRWNEQWHRVRILP